MVKSCQKGGDFAMELWTKEHALQLIPCIAAMLLICVVLRLALGKKSLKIRMIPMQVIAVLIVLLELGKQFLSIKEQYVVGNWYSLPFHFCSLFIFALPIMAFYRGKYRSQVNGATAALCASVFLLMLIYPNLIYGGGSVSTYFTNFMSLHTVTFHNLVMLAFLLFPVLNLHQPKPKEDVKASMLVILVFCTVSAAMAHILKTNFANYYQCNIPILETLRVTIANAVGEVPAKLLYIVIVSGLNFAFVYGAYWFYYLCNRIMNKKKEKVSC